MLARNFTNPSFATKHLLKDVKLMIAEGRRTGLETSVQQGIQQIIQKALDSGWADADYSSIYNAVNPKS